MYNMTTIYMHGLLIDEVIVGGYGMERFLLQYGADIQQSIASLRHATGKSLIQP